MKRANGDGSVRQLPSGAWQGRYVDADDDWQRYGYTRDTGRQELAVRETIAQATEAALRDHPDRSEAQLRADAHRLARALEPTAPDGTIPLAPDERRALLALRFRIRHGL